MQTIAFCEIDPFCRKVLNKHWPRIPVYEDIKTLNRNFLFKVEPSPTSSVEVFRAKMFLQQAKEKVLKDRAQAYGKSMPVSLAKYDPGMLSWKTLRGFSFVGLNRYSGTFPRSGMMQNGIAYRLPPLVRLTDATASGSLPTPTTRDHKDGTAKSCQNVPVNSLLGRAVHYPTPIAGDWKGQRQEGRDRLNVSGVIKLQYPTPRANNQPNATPGLVGRSDGNLETAIADMGEFGTLNPTFVEWLLGYPIGWSDLKR